MISWLDIIILSIVEGITEFLPISSTGHMIITKEILQMPDSPALEAFLIIVQAGAILAVFSLFWPMFWGWLGAWLELLSIKLPNLNPSSQDPSQQQGVSAQDRRKHSLMIAVSVVPFAVIGFALRHKIHDLFSAKVVAMALVVGGILILLAERLQKDELAAESVGVSTLSLKQSLILGLGQCLALWPGFSRSAATILTGRCLGFSRKESAEISFIIGLPTLLGTAGYEGLKEMSSLNGEWFGFLAVGILIAWVVAYVCVKGFVAFLRRYSLSAFAYYRIVVGGIILLYYAKP